jgi:hypothetical protein
MERANSIKGFGGFAGKSMLVQTLTYFAFGLIMSAVFNYGELFQREIIRDFMRPIDSRWVMAGPFLQPIRGFLIALAIWPLRGFIFDRKNAWLILWGIFVVFGILTPPSAAPGSIEGVIYSKLPIWYHLIGLPEMLLQTFCFSLIFTWWVKRPAKKQAMESMGRKRAITIKVIFAIMIGCFAYIGYAVGSILSAKISGVHIKLNAETLAFKRQFMFVFAFLINVIGILVITGKSLLGRIPYLLLFVIFWAVDSLSILIYQFVFWKMMPFHLAALIGLFPSLVILASYKINYKNFSLANEALKA